MSLIEILESKIPKKISKILFDNKAIISGKCMVYLKYCKNTDIINIYVNIDDSIILLKDLLDFDFEYMSHDFQYGSESEKMGEIILKKKDYNFNIIICSGPAKDSILNLPLTCMQVWYNGRKLGGKYVEDFKKDITYMNGQCTDYYDIKPYEKMGLKIIDTFLYNYKVIDKSRKGCKTINHIEEILKDTKYLEELPWYLKKRGFIPFIFKSISHYVLLSPPPQRYESAFPAESVIDLTARAGAAMVLAEF